jgi:hypothetical protein
MMWFNVEIPVSIISFLFVFLGALLRTIFPYLKKVKEQEDDNKARAAINLPQFADLSFNDTYLAIFGADVLLSFIATMLFFSTWSPPDGSLFQVAIVSFVGGWGFQDITNRLATG